MNRPNVPRTEPFIVIFGTALLVVGLSLNLSVVTAKEKKESPYALLVGTCFNEKGFSLPGVIIMVEMKSEAVQKAKKKKWNMISNSHGEFAVRLPAGDHTFLVSASKKGVKYTEKTVTFTGDERQDVVFNMDTVSEQK